LKFQKCLRKNAVEALASQRKHFVNKKKRPQSDILRVYNIAIRELPYYKMPSFQMNNTQ